MDINIYQRERKKDTLIRRAKFLTYGLALIIFAFWGFFWIPAFRISIIKSDNYVPENEVKTAINPYLTSLNSFLLPNDNFFLIKESQIEIVLKEKGIGLATVKKKFPNSIAIAFPQNEPWLLYCSDLECFYVSDKGFLIDRAPKFSPNPLPEIIIEDKSAKIGDGVASAEQIIFLRIIFEKLSKSNITVSSVVFGNRSEIKIVTNENWYLKMFNNINAEKTLNDLVLLLYEKIKDGRLNLEYIDMRFPDKAFYKLRGI